MKWAGKILIPRKHKDLSLDPQHPHESRMLEGREWRSSPPPEILTNQSCI